MIVARPRKAAGQLRAEPMEPSLDQIRHVVLPGLARERGSSAPLDRDLGKREPLILKIPALWAQATSSVGETP